MFCSLVNVAVVVCAVVVLVKLHPHSVQAVQIVEDVERKVILARGGMLVLAALVEQRRVESYLLSCDGWIFVLEEFCP